MAKNNRISRWRDHDLTVIENYLRRKTDRRTAQREQPVEEPFVGWRGDSFEPIPNTGLVTSTLEDANAIYRSGLRPQGGSSVNLGGFRAGIGTDDGDVYRVSDDDQGLVIINTAKVMTQDPGSFSVWLKGFDGGAGSGNEYETVLMLGEFNDAATPEYEPSMVVRFEKDFAATTAIGDSLRLYPDLTNFPDDYMVIDIDEADWQVEDWKKLTITWSYQTQEWTLTLGDSSGTRVGANIIPHPGWGEFTHVDLFADSNGYNNVYHDCQFLVFAPLSSSDEGATIDVSKFLFFTNTNLEGLTNVITGKKERTPPTMVVDSNGEPYMLT